MKKLIMFFMLSAIVLTTYAQKENASIVQIDISADAHAFMCPFLTPKYIDLLKRHYNCEVWKSEDLVIHLKCNRESKPLFENLYKDAEIIGYKRDFIHITEKNIEIMK